MKGIFSHIGYSWHKFSLDLFISLALIVLTSTVYIQVRNDNFINIDDPVYVTENAHVQEGISLNSIEWAFDGIHANFWHPVTWLSLMLDYQLFGLNPAGYHLINLLFHLLNVLLLFFIFRKMTGMIWPSAFIAALFAIHPLHVESVAWIAERKDLLSTFFFLLTIWSYTRYIDRQSIGRYCLMLIFFALGLMSKPMLVTLPFVLLLLDVWPLERFRFQSWHSRSGSQKAVSPFDLVKEKIPLFVLTAVLCLIAFRAQGQAIASLQSYPFPERIANALLAYVIYIGKMVYPVNLAIFYPYPAFFPWWKIAGASLVLGGISFLAFKTRKRHPYLLVGWLWYLGTLVPVIGLVQVGSYALADRFTYIPLIGLFIMIAWGIPDLLAQWRYKEIGLAISAGIIIAVLSVMTFRQITYWKNSTTISEHAIQVTSDNYFAHNSLGSALKRRGLIKKAIQQYLCVIRIKPGFANGYYNLANIFRDQGKPHEAIQYYARALTINPNMAPAENNLATVLLNQGQTDEAIKDYIKALRINPDYVDAYYNIGIAYYNKGDIAKAVDSFRAAAKLNPYDRDIRNALERALAAQGQSR